MTCILSKRFITTKKVKIYNADKSDNASSFSKIRLLNFCIGTKNQKVHPL